VRSLLDTFLPKQCYVITSQKIMILNLTTFRNVLVGVLQRSALRHVAFLAVSDHQPTRDADLGIDVDDVDDTSVGMLGEGRVGFVARWLDPEHELDLKQKKGVMAGSLIEFDLPVCGVVKTVVTDEPYGMQKTHYSSRFKFSPAIRRFGPNLFFLLFFIGWVVMNGVVLWVIIRDSNFISLALVIAFDVFWIPFSLQLRHLFVVAFSSVGVIYAPPTKVKDDVIVDI
jgi:hypothetical protein